MNNYIRAIKPSASMDLMSMAIKLKQEGNDIINLAGGEPDFDTPMIIKQIAIEELNKGNTHYRVGPGSRLLREKISQKLENDNNIKVSPEEIIVTPGGKMAIYLAIRACINVGDEVIIPVPSWVSYREIVISAGGIPIEVELSNSNGYKLDEQKISNYITSKTRMIIINTPNNPTGHIIDEDEIDMIQRLVTGKDIYILSDEIYEKIVFDDKKVVSPASYAQLRDRTITVNGFSKAYAMTGWRIGYVAANKEVISIISKLFAHTITGVSPFIQDAAIAAFDCDREVEIMRCEYQKRRNFFIRELNLLNNVKASIPEGAFYAWVQFANGKIDSCTIAEQLLKSAGIIGVPGPAYGSTEDGYIRFSFANKDDELMETISRLRKMLV